MTKQHLDRLQAWRLKIIQHAQSTGNVAKTCRHFGISRMAYYNWLKRYQQEGIAGLRDKHWGLIVVPARHHRRSSTRSSICASTIIWDHGASACISYAITIW